MKTMISKIVKVLVTLWKDTMSLPPAALAAQRDFPNGGKCHSCGEITPGTECLCCVADRSW